MHPSAENRTRTNLLALFAFIVVGLAVFSPVLNGPFLPWDDREHLELNPLVTNQNFAEIWTRPYFGLYIPVTYSVWAVIYRFTSSPSAFHVFNVLLHSLCAWLVFLILKRTSKEKWPPWIGAGLFLLHPLQVEPVAWISGARDLLAGFFGLLTLHWIAGRKSAASYIAGLLSKPTLAVLPAGICALHRERWRKLAVFLALGIFFASLAYWIQIPELASTGERISFWYRPLIAFDSLGFYFSKLFDMRVSADYGRSPSAVIDHHLYFQTLPWLILASILFRSASRSLQKYGAFALILLLPVLGLVPFQAQAQSTVADRYVYLSMFGIAAIASELSERRKYRIALCAGLAACAFLSFQRAKVWSSSEAFFTAMFTDNPRSYPAHVSLGMIELFKHNPQSAEMHLREAMKLRENNAEAAANLASLLWVGGRPQAILEDLEPLLRDPIYMETNRTATRAVSMLYRLVARAEASQGLGEKARLDYCLFLSMDPENPEGREEVQAFLSKAKVSCSL
jgi:hypothetical protein